MYAILLYYKLILVYYHQKILWWYAQMITNCKSLEDYLNYLGFIIARNKYTLLECKFDLKLIFLYVQGVRNTNSQPFAISAKRAIADWLQERPSYNPQCNALLIINKKTRISTRTV